MSVASNAQYAVAGTKVFAIPELLEIILIDVARSEIDFWPRTEFIRSPFILRAVNRDFRDTIDGSAKLLSFRLESWDSGPVWGEPHVKSEEFGPLFWLQSMTGLDCTPLSYKEDGVLHIHLIIRAVCEYNENRRTKLRKDLQGSWRKMPCAPDPKAISRVMLHFNRMKVTERNITQTLDFQTRDLGPAPTLGLVFDMMDAGQTAANIFHRSEGLFADF